MKKKILFIILSLILACLIFLGGIYLGKKTEPSNLFKEGKICLPETAKTQNLYHYTLTGYGMIKEISSSNLIVTSGDRDFNLKIVDDLSLFFQVTKMAGDQFVERERINYEDLKANDQIFFDATLNEEGGFTLYWLNVKMKE